MYGYKNINNLRLKRLFSSRDWRAYIITYYVKLYTSGLKTQLKAIN